MSSTSNELMWAKQLCTDLSLTAQKPTLWGDNIRANLLAVNPISTDRSKHIRVRHLRVREYVELDEMTVKWIGTKEVLADGFTKVLPGLHLLMLETRYNFGTLIFVGECCDMRQCRCGYQCTCYGLMHGRLTICLRILSRVRNML